MQERKNNKIYTKRVNWYGLNEVEIIFTDGSVIYEEAIPLLTNLIGKNLGCTISKSRLLNDIEDYHLMFTNTNPHSHLNRRKEYDDNEWN